MNDVKRTAEKVEGKVFMITENKTNLSKDERIINKVEIITTEVNEDILKEYETDRKLQAQGFKTQEKKNLKQLKQLEKDHKKYSNERGYKQYLKNYDKYEMYEGFITNNTPVESFLVGEGLDEFNKYVKVRDKYKNFYVTKQQETQMINCRNNIKSFKDIWEEDAMFINQIKEARKLLK